LEITTWDCLQHQTIKISSSNTTGSIFSHFTPTLGLLA
jgi:hypothetical protein